MTYLRINLKTIGELSPVVLKQYKVIVIFCLKIGFKVVIKYCFVNSLVVIRLS